MTIDDVFHILSERDSTLYVRSGRLVYVGISLLRDDPLRAGIHEHRDELLDLFASPKDRCIFAPCRAVLASDDPIACAEHRRQLDATPMSWDRVTEVTR
jgi:hypothetical protein